MNVFGITGASGSGKTTLIEKLLPILRSHGLRLSVIKHTHHGFDIDQPGKDSFRMREAGATEVLLSSDKRWVLMHELAGEKEPSLEDQLRHMSSVDLVLVEGYRRAPISKIEVWREPLGEAPRFSSDSTIVGIAVDGKAPDGCDLPIMQLSEPEDIASFILQYSRAVAI